VVERCIYGVDLDPIAVELCRLALWVETMDRTLPFSFLDHKIRCGNGLVGAWMDQFEHYPVMAWDRLAGDDKHDRFVHHFHEKTATRGKGAGKTNRAGDPWSQAVKDQKNTVKADLVEWLSGQMRTGETGQGPNAAGRLKGFREILAGIHALPTHEAAARKAAYAEIMASSDYLDLKSRMDLWCSMWFWPPGCCDVAPVPSNFAGDNAAAQETARDLAATWRFFHWELEFPDVYTAPGSGFDAVLGNPPWNIAKPSSKEFFSAHDPLFRGYGKQEALEAQIGYFTALPQLEERWIAYQDGYKALSNWARNAGFPFGDRVSHDESGNASNDFGLGTGGAGSRRHSEERHLVWNRRRGRANGYADPEHPFRHQGSADINLYKLFLEQAHALLRPDGRMGFIVPSGLYSDHGTGALRRLFLGKCQWEWIFGFENRDAIFDIHRSFKFNPIIVQKGGTTRAINTAFMRRRLEDWERGEAYSTPYSLQQVERFSPKSMAILEIQSARDLEILEKIYSNSVLLGDDGPDGWGIKYRCEFHMTNDSKLFPPRPKWEAQGYRPDEYSRWLKGNWRPIAELWAEMRVDPTRPVPLDPECALLLRDADVIRGDHPVRCAQPPYDRIPVPRADIREGIILSREADAFIREGDIEGTALPLYEGRMIGQFDISEKTWISGKGRGSVWEMSDPETKCLEPQFLMSSEHFPDHCSSLVNKVGQMRVTSGTNTRTLITTSLANLPCGDKVATLRPHSADQVTALCAILNSFACDYLTRMRIAGLQVDQHLLYSLAVPTSTHRASASLALLSGSLCFNSTQAAAYWHRVHASNLVTDTMPWRGLWSATPVRRKMTVAMVNAIVASMYGLSWDDVSHLLDGCDLEAGFDGKRCTPKGFWRVDKTSPPAKRVTSLTLGAFRAILDETEESHGDIELGIQRLLSLNSDKGWLPPSGFDGYSGHNSLQYDWQLCQLHEESWRECRLHTVNLLGLSRFSGLQPLQTWSGNSEDRLGGVTPPVGSFTPPNGDGQRSLW
jgi:hypothetical protein